MSYISDGMPYSFSVTRFLVVHSLAAMLSVVGLYPHLMSIDGDRVATTDTSQPTTKRCCCGTADGRCCGMACCCMPAPNENGSPGQTNNLVQHWNSVVLALLSTERSGTPGTSGLAVSTSSPYSVLPATSTLQSEGVRLQT